MPTPIRKFMLAAVLAASLLTGCKPGGGSKPLPASETRVPAKPAPEENTGTSAPAARRPLAEGAGNWSAPVPAPPRTPLAVLNAKLQKNPAAPDADKTLLNIAKHQMGRGELESAGQNLARLQEKFPLSPLYPESTFYQGLALQASGRADEAWISLRSSLSRERMPERRALLEAALGSVYETRGDPFSALLSYARALKSDAQIFRKEVLIRRIEALARDAALHRLRTAAERFAGTPAGLYLQSALAEREQPEETDKTARGEAPGYPHTPSQSRMQEPDAHLAAHPGRVGVMLPLSGALGTAGERVYQGIQLALRHSLAKYPTLRIQLAVRDTKSGAQSAGDAAAVAAELIEQEGATALIGPLITEAAQAAAEVANRLKAPMLTPFALRMRMSPDYPWAFRNSLTGRLQARGVAVYAIRHLGVRRFAVLHPAQRDGIALTDAFTQAVANLGGEVVQTVSFPEDATDFGPQMRALGGMDDRQLNRRKHSLGLKKSDPHDLKLNFEALFVPVRHEKAVLIAPQVPFYNMRGVRLFGGSGWNDPRLLEHGEHYVEGAVFVDGFFAGSAERGVVHFVNKFKDIFGKTPDIFSALGYDAAQIIFTAIAQGAKTREGVRRYLASLRGFAGVMGRTDMGADNDTRRELFVLSVEKKKIRHLQMIAPSHTFAGGGGNALLPPALNPPTQ